MRLIVKKIFTINQILPIKYLIEVVSLSMHYKVAKMTTFDQQ